jgi:hypothetical protein
VRAVKLKVLKESKDDVVSSRQLPAVTG